MGQTSQPSILVLASEPNIAAELAFRANRVGCMALSPRAEESLAEAAFRLQPNVALVQSGLPELHSEHTVAVIRGVGAVVVVFNEGYLHSTDPQERRERQLSLMIPDEAFRAVLHGASNSGRRLEDSTRAPRSRMILEWAHRTYRSRAARLMA